MYTEDIMLYIHVWFNQIFISCQHWVIHVSLYNRQTLGQFFEPLYAPGMAYQLMPIGSFLQKGYLLHGDKRKMTIRKPNGTSIMEFHPHNWDPSIYWLYAKVVESKKSLSALAMSAQGYNLWHLRLGHPSAGVLSQVPRHTTSGPDQLLPPTQHSLCKGCAQGMMTSSSFPNSSSQATEPFTLIHSNLKTIPVIWCKYVYAWICINIPKSPN